MLCPDCRADPPNIIEDGAELVCSDCGVVLADRLISSESEWRTFNSDDSRGEDPNRVGEADNDLLTSSNIGTSIGGGYSSGATRKLQMTQQKISANKSDAKLQDAYSRLNEWGNQLKIQSGPLNLAKRYYSKVAESPVFRGKNVDGILAGCLFIACRQQKVPRSFAEIYGITSVAKKEIGRMYKLLEKFLREDDNKERQAQNQGGLLENAGPEFTATPTLTAVQMIDRICNQTGLDSRYIVNYATDLATRIGDIQELAGRSPLSTAAACIYMAAHLVGTPKSYKEISRFANVSDATIKQAYKKLWEVRWRFVKKEWVKVDGVTPVDIDGLPSS